MKKCPYCAEEIQDAAIKCKHCRKMLPTSLGSAATSPVDSPDRWATVAPSPPPVGQCPSCKKLNLGESRFCSDCGASLIEACQVPGDAEATAKAARLEEKKSDIIAQAETLITAGRFGEAVVVLDEGLSSFEDTKLTGLRQHAEKQHRLIELSEKVIPQSIQEKRYVAAQAYLDELVALNSDIEGASDTRQEIKRSIKEATFGTQRGDQLFEARNHSAANAAYQQALAVCADYEPAEQGVRRATSAIQSARNLRWATLATGSAVVVTALILVCLHMLGIQSDERAWKNATEGAAGTNYEQAIQQYRQYLDQLPAGRHAAQAKSLVEVTLPQQMDDQAWELASTGANSAGTNFEQAIQHYRQYIGIYPHGSHASNATSLVEVILPQQIDDQAWNTANAAANVTGTRYEDAFRYYRQYVDKFPSGRHAAAADDQAWNTTTAAGAAAGTHYEWEFAFYRRYLDRFPAGRHASEATKIFDVELPKLVALRDREAEYQTAVSDAMLHFQKKDWALADQCIKMAMDIKPDGVELKQIIAMQPVIAVELREQQYREALADARRVLANGEPEQAAVFCRAALVAKPDDPTVTQLLQETTESLNRVKPYQDAIRRASSLLDQQKWLEALAAVNAALAIRSGDQAALSIRSKIMEAARDYLKSIPTFNPSEMVDDLFAPPASYVVKDSGGAVIYAAPAQNSYGSGSSPNVGVTSDEAYQKFATHYKGRRIKYSGVVQELLPNENSIIFKGGGILLHRYKVKGTFPDEDSVKLSKLVKGQKLSIVGEISALKVSLLGLSGNVIQVKIDSVLASAYEND